MTTIRFINSLNETKYNSILKHLDREKRPTPDFDLLGYDVEYDTQHDYKLLSQQFSWFSRGKRQKEIFYEKTVDAISLVGMIREVIGRPLKHLVILVSYFSTAEISQIANAMKDFALTPYNRALDAEIQLQSDPETVDYDMGVSGKKKLGEHEDEMILRISDLGGFFRGGLDKVGDAIGLPKLTLDKIEKEKDEEYWKNNMGELLSKHPKEFKDYALRDAEIAVEAYKRLREFFLEKRYSIDVTGFKTASSLSSYLFRKRYLKDGFHVAPVNEVGGVYYEHNPDTENEDERWKKRTRVLKLLRYDWHQVRYYAMLSYWGGRAEAYGRGLTGDDEDLILYDVDSLYPSSACLQPLPNSETKWTTFNNLRKAEGLEGFACVSFDFSKSEKEVFYPCIPVMGFKTGKLYFPLTGNDTWCTLAEVREAIRLGGKSCIKSIYGVGFEPGYRESNHPLRVYMREFMKLKRDPKIEGTYEYEFYKLLLNGPIGKFWETEKDFLTLRILNKYREKVTDWSVEKDVPELYHDWSGIRQKVRKRVGSAWWPEAASLILGKARALMSQFISKGALMAITDSVLLKKKTSIECPALTQLRRVESNLKPDEKLGCVTRAWILRTKVYALWNSKRQIGKVARHAWDIEQDDFKSWVQSSVRNQLAQTTPEWAKHPVRVGQVVRTGRFEDFGKWFPRSHRNPPSLAWDRKRVNNRVNDEADLFRPGSFRILAPLPKIEERVAGRGWPKGKPRRPNAESLVPKPEAFPYTHNNSQLFDDESHGVSIS